ncbi:MATE efflux family protein [Abeliophyllum distichum]|uniref:MATE efflux family protein n=1 Tax=Abeliophyllum distichum TaxID=126358 RepID=A0ABD1V2W0_9LAMI
MNWEPENPRQLELLSTLCSFYQFITASAALYGCRYILGYAFSDEKEVVDYVEEITPLLSLSIIIDSLGAVLSGVARGCGWQHIGAYVNLGAYYLVGIPVAFVLGFIVHLKGKGLWIGMVTGATVQSFLFSLITSLTDWEKQFPIPSFPVIISNGSKRKDIQGDIVEFGMNSFDVMKSL